MRVRLLRSGGRPSRTLAPALLALLVLFAAFSPAPAPAAVTGRDAMPAALTHQLQPLAAVPRFEAQTLDLAALAVEDAQRERDGLAPRYAIPQPVALSPANAGAWETLDGGLSVWRLRVSSPGALSLNLGFTQFRLPKAGRLCVYPLNDPAGGAAWTETDNADHGQLWTQVLPGDALVIELTVPTEFRPETRLELGSVNVGYRDFGRLALAEKAGTCNIDVVCPQGDPWRDEIQAVAVISTGGSTFCTGFMVNNTAQDGKPYFQTANHCGITAGNAASLVCYWNFESPTCGAHGGGSLSQFQSGSTFRATYATSDFTLVELSASPNPAWNVTFAGWDRTASLPTSATAIHHPNTDEKSISFTTTPLQLASYNVPSSPGDGTHLRVITYSAGTTEPGSSGCPLFDQNHHIVGQLHGGPASCTNIDSDYYGRFFISWTGGGSSATRLSTWLDPLSTGATTLALFAPNAQSLAVAPGGGLVASGPVGGPLVPNSITYTLTNRSLATLDWHAASSAFWVDVSPSSGSIPVTGTANVTVSLNAFAASLPAGPWSGSVGFVNDTDHKGDTSRTVTAQVGSPARVYSWTLDTNPGWTMQGSWQYGQPTGVAGDHGTGDPTSGHTGTNVLGYNLAGGYTNSMIETNLTTTAIDCTNLRSVTLRFWRWLGVEQSLYDHAYVRVSSDGVNWTTVWENPGTTLMETAWSQQEYDLSAVAAGKPTVYIRWVMGATDGSWTYCGWNIDDIELWGFTRAPVDVPTGPPAARTALLGNSPNPFNPLTEVAFTLAHDALARLTVHDLRGRLVRTLADGRLPAGAHDVRWDGRDEAGRGVASGTYLLRLAADGVRQETKMLLVR